MMRKRFRFMGKRKKGKPMPAGRSRPKPAASGTARALEGTRLHRRTYFWAAVALLLSFLLGVMVYSARLESPTMDEPVYLLAGYRYLETGDFAFNAEHPPLAKFLAALPLLALDPRLPTETELYRRLDLRAGSYFLFHNRVPPDELLFYGRLPFIVLTVVFGLAIALWTRSRFGPLAALLALLFYALDPNIIAHGRYAATDMAPAALFFLTCVAWDRFLLTKGRWDLLWAGLLLGLACAAKFSCLLLGGILPVLYLIRWRRSPGRYSLRHFAVSLLALALCTAAVIGALYWPDTVRSLTPDGTDALHNVVDPARPAGKVFHWLGTTFDLPAHRYLWGLYQQLVHNEDGHRAYLLGEISQEGRWQYFPVAFAVKTPAALLLGLLFAVGAGIRSLVSGGFGVLRRAPFFWVLLALPPVIFLLVAMASNINIGLRHVLPIYPFLFVLAAVVLVRFRQPLLLMLVVALLLFEHARVAPHYLAFFNSLAGGSGNGVRYLADSNLDWGQDLKKLRAYVETNRVESLCLSYFGPDTYGYYGLEAAPTPAMSDYRAGSGPGCIAAVSASALVGLAQTGFRDAWLKDIEPMDRVGYSIFLYDLRRNR